MEATEASVTGTLRIIAMLLLVWVVLRLIRSRLGGGAARKARWVPPETRAKGDVRIERVSRHDKDGNGGGAQVSDADFEEVK